MVKLQKAPNGNQGVPKRIPHDQDKLKWLAKQLGDAAGQLEGITKKMDSLSIKTLNLRFHRGVLGGLKDITMMIADAEGQLRAENIEKDFGQD